MDLGCGDGAFLKVFSEMQPHWKIYGYDVNQNREDEINRICGPKRFCTGSLEMLPEEIDLVTLNYVAEHLHDVKSVLKLLAPKMSVGGQVSIVVPNLERNPYDIVVADHLSHYCMESLYRQLSAVLNVKVCTEFLEKELFLAGTLAEKGMEENSIMPVRGESLTQKSVEHLRWIRDLAKGFATEHQYFGILGTAIAGSWLTCELNHGESFFVEEDKRKQGSKHLQRSVIAPHDAPPDSCIFLPFLRSAAATIRERISAQTQAVIIDPWMH